MSSSEDFRKNMKARLDYRGGHDQQNRMIKDKLRSLKKALIYSYQSATAVLPDGRQFRCLINPSKLTADNDIKTFSIPFEDIELSNTSMKSDETSWENAEKTSYINLEDNNKKITAEEGYKNRWNTDETRYYINEGSVFTWKENNTDWLVYLKRYEELAYFRATIIRCRYILTLDGQDGEKHEYKAYVRGPTVTSLEWNSKDSKVWNDMNYDLRIIITKDEMTEGFFHRFALLDFQGKRWEVKTVDSISTPGIIDIYLNEYFNNTIEKKRAEEIANAEVTEVESAISGDSIVYPYDVKEYTIAEVGGIWSIDDATKAYINLETSTETTNTVSVEIITGKSGSFNLIYTKTDNTQIIKLITIESL